MSKRGKKIAHLAEYAAVRTVVTLLGVLSDRQARALGRALGAFAWNVAGIRRSLVLECLGRAFPQTDCAELNRLGCECYRNLGSVFFEMFRIHRLSNSEMLEKVSFSGLEELEAALGEGRGVVNVCFHYGNWELMGASGSRMGLPVDAIVRPQTNPLFDRYVSGLRESNGMRLISTHNSAGKIARALRRGRMVSFLSDQDAHRVGVFVPFLGKPASTPIGPALFAWKFGCPVVIAMMLPLGDGRWELRFERAPRPETDDRDEFIRELTQYYTSRLEEQVRKAPEHWFWPHRRWKTEPPC